MYLYWNETLKLKFLFRVFLLWPYRHMELESNFIFPIKKGFEWRGLCYCSGLSTRRPGFDFGIVPLRVVVGE
jgi:hypothetical protein